MFLGKFSGQLDIKDRFSVPSPFRQDLAGEVYVTQGFDRNLQVLTADAFRQVYQAVMSLNIANPLARLLLRVILGSARELAMDGEGQLEIPHELKDFASLQHEIFIVGQGDYFEIWSPEFWSKQEVQVQDAEANAARFSALIVTTRPGTTP